MKVRTTVLALMAPLAMTLAWACAPPEQIVLATPPGVEPPRAELSEIEKAEAIGETTPKADPAPKKSRGEATLLEANSPPTAPGEKKTTASGLTYETLKPGTGAAVKPGQKIQVLYTGTLADTGEVFDSTSRRNNQPFSFTLGSGQVIRGWDEGLAGAKLGEKRRLTIPASLAYGTGGRDKIPPNATLVFEIEMVDAQ